MQIVGAAKVDHAIPETGKHREPLTTASGQPFFESSDRKVNEKIKGIRIRDPFKIRVVLLRHSPAKSVVTACQE